MLLSTDKNEDLVTQLRNYLIRGRNPQSLADEDMQRICHHIQRTATMHTLALQTRTLTPTACCLIASTMASSSLTRLALWGCELETEHIRPIAAALNVRIS